MLDHILGKPSANVRRWQAVLTALVTLLLARRKRAPWGLRWIERLDGRVPVWKAIVGWWTFLYLIRHMDDILGLHAPEPLREYYNRSFYRATWIFTALDAGFWTAMSIRPKWLRDLMSLVFSTYYLVCGNRAAEKVRKVRALVTIDHLRVSWNKGVDNPLLRLVRRLHMPRLGVHKVVMLGRAGKTMPAACHVFYAGSMSEMHECSRLVVDIPGGGFVAMGPASHEEYLADWAIKTRAVVVSVDYAKAPEYPYPYAIDQCYEVYRELMQTKGRCIGMNHKGHRLHTVLAGDSAGGNLAACLQFRILECPEQLPRPDGLLFIYGCFNVDVRAWMTRQETHCLLGEPAAKPRDHLHHESPLAVSSKEPKGKLFKGKRPLRLDEQVRVVSGQQPDKYYVPLTMTSSFTYFNDQVLSPEMMRAMVIMYVGPNARPDFKSDYYLSPRVAPDHLLEQFPPTYFICGEKDPMVDDTVLFAARIRQAQAAKQGVRQHVDLAQCSSQQSLDTPYCEYSKSSLYQRRHSQPRLKPAGSSKFFIGSADVSEDEESAAKPSLLPQSLRMTQFTRPPDSPACVIKLKLVAGMSHGFLQMFSLLPESRQVSQMLARWLDELLAGGSREISPYSRCASHVDNSLKTAENGKSNRSSRASSVKSEEEAGMGESLAMDLLLRRNRNGNKSMRDHHGVEVVSAASMVYRRGSGLADPLS
ncbi:hypothetical protein EV183_005083 [Coemansia sp. RSA 2336]|nr:hypothetical protein EV183_005083 [Coemansia sp. RSA 2336]